MENQASVPAPSLSTFRVFLAVVVSSSHALTLTGWNTPWTWHFGKAAELAVLAFFSMSGFLVAQSFYRSENWKDYFAKRALRIYPAYAAAVILFFAALNVAYFDTLSLRNYWDQGYYLLTNLLFLNFFKPSLAGIFEGNSFPFINGALWTIKIEVLFYCLLPPLLGLGKRLGVRFLLVISYITVCLLLQTFHTGSTQSFEHHLTRELLLPLSYFLAGVLYLLFFRSLPKTTFSQVVLLWAVALPLTVFMTENLSSHYIWRLMATLAAPFLMTVATLTTARLDGGFGSLRIPDLSYSLYLTHFPITQILCALGVHHLHPVLYWSLVLTAQLVFAYFFWKWVERPALALRDHRRQLGCS
jgi:peptidoglycan/LPS O-acetylase OafA/YrhL